ncbi:MAG: hypothetical protein Kow0029_22000 [Candidatus Rifleibacteriota bacterium]
MQHVRMFFEGSEGSKRKMRKMSKALIVSRDANICEKINNVLAGLGIETLVTHSATKALKFLAEDEAISLVVTDRIFKEKEGEWLINNMKKHENYKDIPVIAMAEFTGLKEIANILRAGARAFVPKPLFGQFFREYVLRYIRN